MLQNNVFSKLPTYLLLSTGSLKSEQNRFSGTSNFQMKEFRMRTKPLSVMLESLHECPWQPSAFCLSAIIERKAPLCKVFSRKPLPILNNLSCIEKFPPSNKPKLASCNLFMSILVPSSRERREVLLFLPDVALGIWRSFYLRYPVLALPILHMKSFPDPSHLGTISNKY